MWGGGWRVGDPARRGCLQGAVVGCLREMCIRDSTGAGCDAQKGFPGGISEGLPGVFPVVPGGFRVDLSVSFPMVFPMESPGDIPGGFRLFFRALPGDR